jgi:hypothetical protein
MAAFCVSLVKDWHISSCKHVLPSEVCNQIRETFVHSAGWRAALEALTVALGDGASPVVNQALDAIQPVVEALYRSIHASRRNTLTEQNMLLHVHSIPLRSRFTPSVFCLCCGEPTAQQVQLSMVTLNPKSRTPNTVIVRAARWALGTASSLTWPEAAPEVVIGH